MLIVFLIIIIIIIIANEYIAQLLQIIFLNYTKRHTYILNILQCKRFYYCATSYVYKVIKNFMMVIYKRHFYSDTT